MSHTMVVEDDGEREHVSTSAAGPLAVWTAYNDASNAGDHDTAAHYLHPDLHVLVNGRPAVSSVAEDRAVQSELLRRYPDYCRDYVDGIEVDDVATVEWRMVGTPVAPGIPALDVAGVSIVRLVDGRLAEARLYHPTGALDAVTTHALGRADDV